MSGWKIAGIATLVIIAIIVVMVFGFVFSWCGNAADTAFKEFSPSALLAKYMWFKEVSAQLDKKIADIQVFQGRVDAMTKSYGDTPRNQWMRTDAEQMNIWMSEVAGVKASFNELAAQYNAKMAEINWRFTNVGDLPQGQTQVLPREYKPYITE
jgi:hypothetical protein